MEFKNKVVLITGSTRGIGHGIAKTFLNEGATVIITGRSQDSVDAAVKDLSSKNGKVEGYECDVTNTEKVQEIVNKILDNHNGIDILINNAGITKDNLLLRMSSDDWDQVMSINLKGVFNCTKAVSKVMLKASAKNKGGSATVGGGKSGKIINISSIIGILGNAGQANYAASKAGIIGFTKSVARELASRGITVNALAPGYIQTDMTAQLKEATKEELLKSIPLKKLGTIEDIAGACLFLASNKADYITGQTIVIDGGMAI